MPDNKYFSIPEEHLQKLDEQLLLGEKLKSAEGRAEIGNELEKLGLARDDADASQDEYQAGIARFRNRLYQIAANTGQKRDPALMGTIEQLLSTGDTKGLSTLLGPKGAQFLTGEYLAAIDRFNKDRDSNRSYVRATSDTVVGVGAGVVNAVLGLTMLGAGAADKDAGAKVGEAYRWFNEKVDAVSSDALLAHKKVKEARDAGAEQEHAAQAEAGINPVTRGDLLPGLESFGKRVIKDAASGAYNTLTDPTLLVGGVADTASSMLVAAGTGKVLSAAGKTVAQQAATQVAKQAITRELKDIVGDVAAHQMASSLAKTAGAKMVEGKLAQEGLAKLGFFGSNAVLEGGSQYAQTATKIQAMDPQKLLESSQAYRDMVKTFQEQNPGMPVDEVLKQAKNQLAHDLAVDASLKTGVVAGLLSTAIGGQGINPTQLLKHPERAAGVAREFVKESVDEAIEEGAQGFSGAVLGNQAMNVVDPGADPLEGVGMATGENAALALPSTAMLKSRAALRGTSMAVQEGTGALAGILQNRGAKLEEKARAESAISAENLVERSAQLAQGNEAIQPELASTIQNIANTKGEEAALAPAKAFNALIESSYVSEAPPSLASLPEAHRNALGITDDGTSIRAKVADKTAQLFLAEENPSTKAKLARVLNEVLTPARAFKEESSELEAFNDSPRIREQIKGMRDVLSGIEKLPSVQEALNQGYEVLTNSIAQSSKSPVTENTLTQPETQERAKNLATMAVVDPGSLVQHSSIEEIKVLLKHGEDDGNGTGGLTPEQRKALEGSMALLAPFQALQDKRLQEIAETAAPSLKGTNFLDDITQRHLLSKKLKGGERVSGEVTIEENALESGKYSARQHIDRVIKSMAAGNTEVARISLTHFSEFVEHMDNKVRALNKSLENKGQAQSYKQLLPDRTWADSSTNPKSKYKVVFFKVMSPASIAHAQAVDVESHVLHEILRGMVKAYPELGVQVPVSEARIPGKFRTADPAKMAAENVANWKKAEEKKAKTPAKQEKAPAVQAKTAQERAVEMLSPVQERNVSETKPEPVVETKTESKPEPKVESEPKVQKMEQLPKLTREPKPLDDKLLHSAKSQLQHAQRVELFDNLNKIKDKKARAIAEAQALAVDGVSGLFNETGATKAPVDKKRPFMAVFTLEGKKFLNDFHDHPALDGVFRLMARVLFENGIKDGMKLGGDIQAFFASEAEAQAMAEKMRAELAKLPGGKIFQIAVGGAMRQGDLKATREEAEVKGGKSLRKVADALRSSGQFAHRMAPPVALQKTGMPEGINWDWDEKTNTKGLSPKSPVVQSWLKSLSEQKEVVELAAALKEQPAEQYVEIPTSTRIALNKMSDVEKLAAAYQNPLTGLLSVAGFKLASKGMDVFVSLDMRSLKLMNNKFGEGEADKILQIFADVFKTYGGDFYAAAHLHGDEFAMACKKGDEAAMMEFLAAFKSALDQVTLYKEDDKGNVITQKGISFAWGKGQDLNAADANIKVRKEANREPVSEPVETPASTRAQELLAEAKATPGSIDLGPFGKSKDQRGQADRSGTTGASEAGPVTGGHPAEASPGAAQQQEVAPEPSTRTSDAYPNLYQGTSAKKLKNWFFRGMKIKFLKDGRPLSRLFGKADAVKTLQAAIQTQESLQAFAEKTALSGVATDPVRLSYFRLLNMVSPIVESLGNNLDTFLNTKWKDGKTAGQLLAEESDSINEKSRGKTLNILERQADGTFKYNKELAEQAAIAALQWVISAHQRQQVIKDDDDLISDLDLDLKDGMTMSPELVKALSEGESLIQAKRSLASTIRRFWGVEANKKVGTGYSEAIPEAFAAELFRALQDVNMLEVKTVDLAKEFPDATDKTPQRYVPIEFTDIDATVYEYPELLEEAVVAEPVKQTFFGDDKVPVIQHQMGNPNMSTTKESDKARKAMQDQKFLLNMPLVQSIVDLSPDEIVSLFGHSLPKDKKEQEALYNRIHLDTLEGKNKTLLGGFAELQKTVKQMTNIAIGQQTNLDQVARKYQYAVNSVNRIMMLGANNPQSHKLMRETLLSTWSESLDLSKGLESEHYKYMMLAISQALGEKVHKKTLDENVTWAHNEINGRLAPAIDSLAQWLKAGKTGPSPLFALKEMLGDKMTPLAAMALMEVARMKQATPEELKAFRTPLYFEADGMTNGPFNALGLLTTDAFDKTWVESVGRGGLSFGEESRTANLTIKAMGGKDNYAAAAEATKAATEAHLTALEKQTDENGKPNGKAVAALAKQLFQSMGVLMKGEIKWENDKLTLDRGFVKNPMTVLIYGSGKKGIANKVAYKFTKAFYETMTAVAQTDKGNNIVEKFANVLFPDDVAGMKKAAEFLQAVNALTSQSVRFSKKNGYFSVKTTSDLSTKRLDEPQKFEFTSEEMVNLQNNLRHLVVEPMYQGIRATLGPSVFESGELLVRATKIHSLLARGLFYKAIQDKIAEKVQALQKSGLSEKDANAQVSSEFLSREELTQLWDSLKSVMPIMESDGQRFLLAKTGMMEFFSKEIDEKTGKPKKRTLYEYSRALDDTGRTPPDVTAVDDAGVSAIPYLTIGMGDGRMVRALYEAGLENSLQVFDGINIPVNKIAEYGSRINQAALRAFQGNVFKSLSETFDRAMQDPKTQAAIADTKFMDELNEALTKAGEGEMEFKANISEISALLHQNALYTEARQEALKKVSLSMDQMAGTYQPFVQQGEIKLAPNASTTEIAKALEAERRKALDRLQGKPALPELAPMSVDQPLATPASSDLFAGGTRHESGVMILGKPGIRGLISKLKSQLTKTEHVVLAKALSSGSLNGIKVITGNAEQIMAYQKTNGLSSFTELMAGSQGKTVHGYFSFAEKTVYLMNPQVETVIHELIHASTFNTLLAHYSGKTVSQEAQTAIKKLEGLMASFMDRRLDDGLELVEDNAFTRAMSNARKEIASYAENTAVDKAARLNEFMSWTLANREIADKFGGKTYSKIAKLLQAAWSAIKTFLWGGAETGPAAQSKVLTQIKFNTAILSKEAPKVEEMLLDNQSKQATLAMRETPNRLDRLNETFVRMIARNLNRTYSAKWLASKGAKNEPTLKTPRIIADMTTRAAVAAFPDMNRQARTTFQRMVMAFATDSQINPAAMSKVQEIYEHFMKSLKVEDFMTGEGDPQNDEALARQKFEFLVGHDTKGLKDDQRRSTVLPSFLALASVDDSFRALLAKKNMEMKTKQQILGVDSLLENLGLEAQERVGDKLAGIKQNPLNVQDALDQLTDGIMANVLDEKTSVSNWLEGSENSLSRMANDRMVDALKRVGSSSLKASQALQESSSKLAQALSVGLKAVSFMIDEKDATAVSEGALSWMDKSPNTYAFVRELTNDLLGRVPSQAQIYDMLKKIRTHVTRARQDYREKLPLVIEKQFKHAPNAAQWDSLHRFMGRYDMAALLDRWSMGEAMELASNQAALQSEINRLESTLRSRNARYLGKINQFVKFTQTGIRGGNLLTNAYAISELLGEKLDEPIVPSNETIQDIDQLITLKLLDQAHPRDRRAFAELYTREREGMEFTLNYLKGQRKDELTKALDGMAKYNHVKGAISTTKRDGHVTVAPDEKHADMISLGYTRVGSYKGSSIDSGTGNLSYYYSPDGGAKTTFTQGIAQNVQATAYGVNALSGVELGPNAGVITDSVTVERLAKQMSREAEGQENLSPIYNENGNLVAFVRTLSAEQLARVQEPQHLANAIGRWQGRQVEENWANEVNNRLVSYLADMYNKDTDKDRYENVLTSKDPIIRDAVSLFPKAMRDAIKSHFPDGGFYIRRGMVNAAIGYRQASIGDSWTGVSRISKANQERIRQTMTGLVEGFLGKNAYQTLLWAEKNWQSAMASVRTNIVVRSIIVPTANFVSGLYQLRGRGVPLVAIAKSVPAKLQDVETYTKSLARKVELEAEIRASSKVNETLKLEAELQALLDSQKRLSIWPLIEAGEFSTISDVGDTAEDLETGNSTVVDKIVAAVDKLPAGLRDAARQGYMARDTALFKALQKATQYSDFVMKAIYYDHLLKNETKLLEETPGYLEKTLEVFNKAKEAHLQDNRKPLLSMPQAERIAREEMARGRITEEFVNYDMPTGRTRGYLENMGLIWFQNYKLRSAKIALSMLRNNPFQSLMAMALPPIAGADTPISGNIFAKLFHGVLGYSVGPRMALQPISMNPWYNLLAE